MLPAGTTGITCQATDTAGNVGNLTFSVKVNGAADQIRERLEGPVVDPFLTADAQHGAPLDRGGKARKGLPVHAGPRELPAPASDSPELD